MMKRNGHYWTPADQENLGAAQRFSHLAAIALRVLARMPKPIAQVCGPISTGGLGSLEQNLAVFDATVDQLIRQGLTIFDQVPFENHLFRIIGEDRGARQNNLLLKEFYLPIFESGHVTRLYFIHGWESSHGANWEHQQAQRLGFEIVYLPRHAHKKSPVRIVGRQGGGPLYGEIQHRGAAQSGKDHA